VYMLIRLWTWLCDILLCYVMHLQDDRLSFFDFYNMPDSDRHTVESILYKKTRHVKAVEVSCYVFNSR